MTEKKERPDDISNFFNMNIFGLDIGKIVKNLGITDLASFQDPKKIERLKEYIKHQEESVKKNQEDLQKMLGGKVKIDYDIKIRGLSDGKEGFRISSGKFFEPLDALRKSSTYKTPQRAKIYPGKDGGVIKPAIEVVEEKHYVQVITELAGVKDENIQINQENGKLRISAKGEKKEYVGEITLPAKTATKIHEKTFNNGILKLRFKKLDN